MILISLIFVLISAVTLLIGGLFSEGLTLIYISIASALLAGIFLLLVVVRGRGGGRRPAPRGAKPAGSSADAAPASWASGQWGGTEGASEGSLSRDDEDALPGSAPAMPGDQQADDEAFAPPAAAAPASAPPPPPSAPPAPARPTPPAAPAQPASPPASSGWAPPPPPPRSPGSAPPPPPPA